MGSVWENFLEGVFVSKSWESHLGFAKIGKKAQLGGECVCWGLGWGQ